MTTELLTQGNTAKLYCLQYIDQLASARQGVLRILDLGCGAGLNFVALLKKYPDIQYIGVEPSPEAADAARQALNNYRAEIHTDFAYDVRVDPADVVVSFSVLEHVYRRRAYLECARRNLAATGVFLINYDAGHFVAPGPFRPGTDRWHNLLSPLKAALGIERSYQAFVKEADFRGWINQISLKIIDDKVFNTDLKSIYKLVPAGRQADFMTRWLAWELELNEQGIKYTDAMATVFRTRNFILTHTDR